MEGRPMTRRKGMDRREFVTTAGAAAAAAVPPHAPLVGLCKRSPYEPVTRKWFGFSDNYVPDPGDYLKSVWTEVGMPNGPATWEDLVTAGPQIKAKHPEIQIPIGIGMSQELDTNMATRAM